MPGMKPMDCGMAAIEVTPEMVTAVEQRIQVAREAKISDPSLEELFFEKPVGVKIEWIPDEGLSDETLDTIEPEGAELLWGWGSLDLPDDFDLSPFDPQPTYVARFCVLPNDVEHIYVRWWFYPGNDYSTIRTANIGLDTLQSALAEDNVSA